MRTSFLVALLLYALSLACSDDGGTGSDLGRDAGIDAQPGDGTPVDRGPLPPDGPPPPGSFSEVQAFGSNPGNLRMFKYVPGAMPAAPAPLVVALHGCSLRADEYAAASGWNELSDARRFYLLYPQQSTANNQYACFNWFEPGDYSRDKGESLSIMQMIDQMKKDHPIDPARIYATGLSAGGAMAVNLGVSYPDRLAGLAVMAGIPYGCASGPVSGVTCMNGTDKTPAEWAAAARQADPGYGGPYPVASVFQGSADGMIAPSTLQELVEQWTALHGADLTAEVDDKVAGHTHRVYRDKQGTAVVESFQLQGMGHGIAVDPGSGPGQGGKTAWFAFDMNLWSSWYAAKFWGL